MKKVSSLLHGPFFCVAMLVLVVVLSASRSWCFSIDYQFIGNNDIDLRVETHDNGTCTLTRGSRVIRTWNSVEETLILTDSGLSKGTSYTYTVFCDHQNYQFQETITLTAGEVKGTITRDMTWSGEWNLNWHVLVSGGHVLTIAPETMVKGPRETDGLTSYDLRFDSGSAIDADGVIFDGVALRGDGTLKVRGSTLIGTGYLRASDIADFSLNSGTWKAFTIQQPKVDKEHLFVGNNFPGSTLYVTFDSTPSGPLTISDNTLGCLTFYDNSPQSSPIQGKLTLTGNSLVPSSPGTGYLSIARFSGPLLIEDNTFPDGMSIGLASVPPGVDTSRLINGNRAAHARISGVASGIKVQKNSVSGGAYGFVITGLITDSEFSGNTIANSIYEDFSFSGNLVDPPLENNLIHDNLIINDTGDITISLGGMVKNNKFYNNWFRVTNPAKGIIFSQTECSNCTNQWSVEPSPGPNIAGGPQIGGNRWDYPWWNTYRMNDTNHDGFANVPMVLTPALGIAGTNSNIDNFPLMPNLYADLLIKRWAEPPASYTANDLYETTPSGKQEKTQSLSPGEKASFDVKIENDSEDAASFVLKTVETKETGWTITYKAGGDDVTAAIRSQGGYKTGEVAPGSSTAISVEMSPDETVKLGTGKSAVISIYLEGSLIVPQDAVRATAQLGIVVNSITDEPDADPNDGVPDTDLTTEGLQTTLRAAIQEVDRRSGPQTIIFDIPGGEAPTITLASPLPAITNSITIDGATQAGSKVRLYGAGAGAGAHGFRITGGDYAIIKGFEIKGFQGNGIFSEVSSASEGNPAHHVRVDAFEASNNGGWGILTSDNIDINYDRTGRVNTSNTASKFTGNTLGGIRSRGGNITGYKIESSSNKGPGILAERSITLTDSKSNNNRGPGIQSFTGTVWIKNSTGAANEVIGNKGHGIYSGLPLCVDTSEGNCTPAVHVETAIELRNNSLWGIYGDGPIRINTPTGVFSPVVNDRLSSISNNGNNSECWWIEESNLETSSQGVCSVAGGIFSRHASISAINATVSSNRGAGLLAKRDITLMDIRSLDNKGPGIQSFTGTVHVWNSPNAANEVIGNKGYGILTGKEVCVDTGSDDCVPAVLIATSIDVKDNSNWGISGVGSIFVNADSKLLTRCRDKASLISGNGYNTECWGVEDMDRGIAHQGVCRSAGGILSVDGGIVANQAEAASNNGAGLVAKKGISLAAIRSLNNKGPGIYSFAGTVQIRNCDECSNQVIGNKGDGIYSGLLQGLPGSPWGVLVSHPVEVRSNSMWGIRAESSVGLNIVPPNLTVPKGPSIISGNGTGAECREVDERNLELVMKVSCSPAARGGVHSRYGSVIGRIVDVTGNSGRGISAAQGLDLAEGQQICNNTGGNLFTGGTKTVLNISFCDADSDNVSDAVENAGLNAGDGNRDTIPDSQQANVTSLVTVTGLQATLASPSGTSLVEVSSAAAPARDTMPQGVNFAIGALGFGVSDNRMPTFRIRPMEAGASRILTLYLPSGIGLNTYYAYGPTTNNPQPHWYEFLFDGTTGAEFQTDKVVLHLVDGGRGDDDLTANGEIAHSGAPGFFTGVALTPESHYFGFVTIGEAAPSKTFTLANLSALSVTLGQPTLSGTDLSDFSIGGRTTCSGSPLVPSGECLLEIIFAPLTEGWKEAMVSIPVTGAQAPEVTADLSGQAGIIRAYTLTVTRAGDGSGTVTTNPPGIDCGSLCSSSFPSGEVVTLTATAGSGSLFTGWSGACSDASPSCSLVMDTPREVVVTFIEKRLPLGTVTINGGAADTTNPAVTLALSCSGEIACTNMTFSNDFVTWSTPEPFSAVKQWNLSAGSGTKTVFVKFQGDNGLWSFPAGASIGLNMSLIQYASLVKGYSSQYGTSTWSASQATGASNVTFYGDNSKAWAPSPKNGATSDAREWITLEFATPAYAEGVIIRETFGNGFVTKVEALDMTDEFHLVWEGTDPSQPGTTVNFDVSWPRTDYLVKGVKITIDPNHNMNAWEEIDSVQLKSPAEAPKKLVLVNRTGSGTVTSDPSGIDCGETCFALFEAGTQVTLSTSPGIDSEFKSWEGSCTGTGQCRFTVNSNTMVSALFGPKGEVSLLLSRGWNFISLPTQPMDPSINVVLKDISHNVRVVWGYENENKRWFKYKPSAISYQLSTIEAGKGYWIYMDSPATLAIAGADASSTVQLYPGWNLVGYNGTDNWDADASLSTLSGKWEIIWGWENGKWYAKKAPDVAATVNAPELTTLNRGKAYWIKVKEAVEWQQ